MTAPENRPPRIDGYQHIDYLGSGGFGEVHRYEHIETGAAVAIKILRDGALAAGGTQQLMKEARALGRLSSAGPHPNIVAVQGIGQADGRPYLVMEFCSGGSWADQISDRGRLHPSTVLSVGIQIAGALHMAHQAGIVHRDIKPGNILLGVKVGGHSTPKLGDFGIAALTAEEVSRGSAWLSRDYAAPEVVQSRGANHMSDIFSLAATLYHALAGSSWVRRAGEDNSAEALEERILLGRVPAIQGADIPEELQWLIRSAMHAEPTVRARNVASARDFALRLQDIQIREGYDRTLVPIGDMAGPVPDAAVPMVAVTPSPPQVANQDLYDGSPYDSAPFDSILAEAQPPKPRADDSHARADTERARPIPSTAPTGSTSRLPRFRRRTLIVLAAGVVAVGALVGVNVLAGPDAEPTVNVTVAPGGDDAVPHNDTMPVPTVTAQRGAGGAVTFSWTYSPAEPGDRFNVQRSGQAKAEIVDTPKWTAPAGSGSEVCLRVSVIRNNRVGVPSTQVCA